MPIAPTRALKLTLKPANGAIRRIYSAQVRDFPRMVLVRCADIIILEDFNYGH
nr:MAG TPA: hypothetical protein [Caudoviricetes sp.]